MSSKKGAFEKKIEEGQVRIVLNITSMNISINNVADDFVDVEKDEPVLKVSIKDFGISELTDGYELNFIGEANSLHLNTDIWFDVEMDEVSKVLNNPIHFEVEGNESDYITYFIDDLKYKLEWLQHDKTKDEISTVSVSKKSYAQPIIESERQYSLVEIAKGAELLSKAIKKIDLRTGSAYVRLNTNGGEFDPVISIIAKNMGYKVVSLDEDTIDELLKEGRRATHKISLLLNF